MSLCTDHVGFLGIPSSLVSDSEGTERDRYLEAPAPAVRDRRKPERSTSRRIIVKERGNQGGVQGKQWLM